MAPELKDKALHGKKSHLNSGLPGRHRGEDADGDPACLLLRESLADRKLGSMRYSVWAAAWHSRPDQLSRPAGIPGSRREAKTQAARIARRQG